MNCKTEVDDVKRYTVFETNRTWSVGTPDSVSTSWAAVGPMSPVNVLFVLPIWVISTKWTLPADWTAFCDFEIRRETVLEFDAVLELALQLATNSATPITGRKWRSFVLTA